MTVRTLPLSGDQFVARVRAAPSSTSDDVSITREGRRLNSKAAVLAWLAEVEADRAAGRYVEFDDEMNGRLSTSTDSSQLLTVTGSTTSSSVAWLRLPTAPSARPPISTA